MSNEIRTRRLLVTLPETSGHDAEGDRHSIDSLLHNGARVEHALDDASVSDFVVRVHPTASWLVDIQAPASNEDSVIPPDDARKLAGLLLRAADEAEHGVN